MRIPRPSPCTGHEKGLDWIRRFPEVDPSAELATRYAIPPIALSTRTANPK
ncbi:hypothetical protein MOKP126_45430 [Mycobacterium avium subsp. hominissuis]